MEGFPRRKGFPYPPTRLPFLCSHTEGHLCVSVQNCQVTLNEWLKSTLSQECLFSDLLKIRVWERNVYLVTRI